MVASYLCCEGCDNDAEDSSTGTRYCWHCGYITAKGKVLQATPDHSKLVKRCGSPVAALQDLLYGKPDLPDGAVPHLVGLPEEQRGVLVRVLKEFKSVFPAELPKHVPPDR